MEPESGVHVTREFDETLRFHGGKWQVSKPSNVPCPEAVITPIDGNFDPHTQHLNNGYIPATLDLKAFPKAEFPVHQEGVDDKNDSDSKSAHSMRMNDDNDIDATCVAATIPFLEGDYESEEKESKDNSKDEEKEKKDK